MLKLLMAAGLGFLVPTALHRVAEPQSTVVAETVDEASNVSEVTPEAPQTLEMVVLNGATPDEEHLMEVLQARGITHPNALATILGNIKAESLFNTNICEGGARVNYEHCHTGGFGLIQWTTQGRYNGLGHHARNLGLSPTSLEAQVSYIFREVEWRQVEHHFKNPGQKVDWYMRHAFRWLGWGVHGRRTAYSIQYVKRMEVVSVPAADHPTSKFTSDHHYLK